MEEEPREEVITYYQERCRRAGVTDSAECQRLVAHDLDPACRAANILAPSRCEEFLKDQFLKPFCDATVTATDITCEQAIIDQHKDVILCGDRTADDCKKTATTLYIGQIAAGLSTERSIALRLESRSTKHIAPRELKDILIAEHIAPDFVPLSENNDGSLSLIPSKSMIDVSSDVKVSITTAVVIIPDVDGDTLPNDLEALLGTDPVSADTDGDAFTHASKKPNR